MIGRLMEQDTGESRGKKNPERDVQCTKGTIRVGGNPILLGGASTPNGGHRKSGIGEGGGEGAKNKATTTTIDR